MNRVQAVAALREIKAECLKHEHCYNCPLFVDGEWEVACIIDCSDLPSAWEVVILNEE